MPGAGENNNDPNNPNPNPNPGGDGGGGNPNPNPNPGGSGGGGGTGGFTDLTAANAEIEKLRKESASHRVKNKDLESKLSNYDKNFAAINAKLGIKDPEADPVKALEQKEARIAELEATLEFKDSARALGVSPEYEDLFATLINKKAQGLKDGDELSDAQVEEVVKEIKALEAVRKQGTGVQPPSNNGGGQGGGNNNDEITAEKYAKMTLAEKNALYLKNADLHNRLFNEAKQKNLLR